MKKDKEKSLKDTSVKKGKGDMKKEDEVRPKEKVGRPKVDPKKIKVIQPKKKVDQKIEEFIKDADMNPLNDLAKKITSAESSIFTKVAAGELLGSQRGKGVSVDTARKLIGKKLNEDGFEFVLGYGKVDPLPAKNTSDGKLVVSLLEKFRDENKLTNSKAWSKVVKLAEKQVKKDKGKSKALPKERIQEVFKAIMKNYTAILQDKKDNEGVKISKSIEKLLSEGKMTFEKPQKEIIVKAIPAYLDLLPTAGNTEQIAIAKDLQKKYKEEKKVDEKYSKDEIITVFKDIMTGYTEILQEGLGSGSTQRQVNTSKAVEKKLAEGKMTFTKPQKETIKKAIDAYIDTIEVDMPDSKELAIAKDLQKKYK
jgi:hypothetical protein